MKSSGARARMVRLTPGGLLRLHPGEIVACECPVRAKGDGLLERRHRFGEEAQRAERPAEVVERVRVVGLERDGVTIGDGGLEMAALARQREADREVFRRRARARGARIVRRGVRITWKHA